MVNLSNNYLIILSIFRRHYRFTKEGVLKLTDLIEEKLKCQDGRGSPLTPLQQICLVLSYFGGGTFQHTAGYIAGVKKTCSNTAVKRVTEAICGLAAETIQMPERRQMRESAQFFEER